MTRSAPPLPPWASRILRLALGCWPASARRRDRLGILASVADDGRARDPGPRRAAWVVREAVSIAAAGFRLRVRGLSTFLNTLARDAAAAARLAARSLLRSPRYLAAAVGTVAIGTGLVAAVYGTVDALLLQPPAYGDPDELVLVWNTRGAEAERLPVVAPDVPLLREGVSAFAGVAFVNRITDGGMDTGTDGSVQHVGVAAVTADFFQVLGVTPLLGRTFADDGTAPSGDDAGQDPDSSGEPPPILLSHATWTSLLGADRGVVGRTIRLNGRLARVTGVLPRSFRLELPPASGMATEADVWTGLGSPLEDFRRPDGRRRDRDSDNSGAVIARLASGATLAEARAQAEGVARDLRRVRPDYDAAGLGFQVRPLREDVAAHLRPLLLMLMVGAGLTLANALLNLSALNLGRELRREREVAVQRALGASGRHLLLRRVVESLVVAGASVPPALVLAYGLAAAIAAWAPPGVLRPDVSLPGMAGLGLAAAATAVAAVVGILVPPPALRWGPMQALERMGRSGSQDRVQGTLVAGQVALSVVLTLSAVLLLRTLGELRHVDPGFEPRGALTFSVSLRSPDRYGSPAERAALMHEVARRLGELPGADAVGLTGHLPLSGRRWTQPWGRAGESRDAWSANRADFRTVTSGYFAALGARLVEGRAFTSREDLHEDERVVIVDRILARRLVPDGSAVGHSLAFPLDGRDVVARVVGVVEPIRHDALEVAGRGGIFVPYRQEASRDVSFVVRGDDPLRMAPGIRTVIRTVDPQLPVFDIRPLHEYVDAHLASRRMALAVLTLFASVALASVAMGLYSVVALEVGRRTRALGIRIAVGASRGRIARTVLWRGLRLGVAGLLLGAGVSFVLWSGFRSILFNLTPLDPLTWALVAAGVLAVTLLACWVPAGRAVRVDPVGALRAD